MKLSLKKIAAASVLAGFGIALASPAQAVVATSITIKSGFAWGDWLQIGELQVFAGGVNVALASNGATVFGSGSYDAFSTPDKAIDGNISTAYPNIYHSDGTGPTEYLEVKFANAVDISDIVIYGRSDCCSERNLFTYELREFGRYGSVLVAEGTLDARNANATASAQLQTTAPVPEPAAWALMIGGFAFAGLAMRHRKATIAFA